MVFQLNTSMSATTSTTQPEAPTLWATSGSETREVDTTEKHHQIIVRRSLFYSVTVSQQRSNRDLKEKFQRLVGQWHVERGASSSITQTVLCSAYQSIIGMGQPAVSLLLDQLKSEGDDPDQWFWALCAITGCQPVPEKDVGNFVQMARHWLDWGRRNGYDL